MTKDNNLVYSTDPSFKKCDQCKQYTASCTCNKTSGTVDHTSIRVVLRLEKAHRGGKDVTIIDRLPPNECFLKNLAQELKKNCGTGGTFKINGSIGIIEIQGDKRERIRNELEKKGIKCK